jgi:ATP synthase protein I
LSTPDPDPKDSRWQEKVGEKESRKLRARHHKDRSIWFGLGTFGVVGWSVVVPTLLGLFAGIWLDRNVPAPFSWTLMLFMGGLLLGCYNAWRWLNYESGVIEREEEEKDKENGDEE